MNLLFESCALVLLSSGAEYSTMNVLTTLSVYYVYSQLLDRLLSCCILALNSLNQFKKNSIGNCLTTTVLYSVFTECILLSRVLWCPWYYLHVCTQSYALGLSSWLNQSTILPEGITVQYAMLSIQITVYCHVYSLWNFCSMNLLPDGFSTQWNFWP